MSSDKRVDNLAWSDVIGKSILIQRVVGDKNIMEAKVIECGIVYIKMMIKDSKGSDIGVGWYGRYEHRIVRVLP